MFQTLTDSILGSGFSTLLAQAAEAGSASTGTPWYETGWFMAALLIGAVALAVFAGKTIASSLRLPEYGGKLAIILGCIFISTLLVSTKWPPKFGIDLVGGINMVGSLNLDELENEEEGPVGATQTTAKDIIQNLIRRVNPSGTNEIMIRPLGEDKIEVEIPTDSLAEADEIWGRLVKTGKLQFRIVAEEAKFQARHRSIVELARQQAANGFLNRNVKDNEGKIVARWYNLAREDIKDPVPPLPFKESAVPTGASLVRDSVSGQIVANYSLGTNIKKQGVALAKWWAENQPGQPQILLCEPEESKSVEGKHLASITQRTDPRTGLPKVDFVMTAEGGDLLGDFTFEHQPEGDNQFHMAIVLDDHIVSAPTINEAIYGRGEITGNFSPKEVNDLIINLRSGKIDVALNDNPISKQFIESALGEELKQKGIYAITISLIIVLIFMMFYYRFCGVVATLALLLNLLFILAMVMAINQPLTLTGLAGLVLTVGMSVDANVLIFERIREELDRGAALRMAIRNGFDKATTTIVDANVTTLITAIVLYVIGTEQIKGFAVTLILGILMSMFTAIYCSRALFDIWERKRWITELGMARILGKANYNFLNKRAIAGPFVGNLDRYWDRRHVYARSKDFES